MAQKKVGTLVKEARTAKGLTQEQLARKVTGATAADVGKLERGEVDFTQAQLKQIAKATDVTQTSLLNAPKNVSTTAKKTTSSSGTTAKKTTTGSSAAKKTTSSSTAKKTTTSSTAKKTTGTKASSTSKTSASKSTASKTTASKSTAGKSTASSTKKTTTGSATKSTTAKKTTTSSSSGTSLKVTATEKKLVELYRDADTNTKKVVMGILKGELPQPPDASQGSGFPGGIFSTQTTSASTKNSGSDDFISALISGALEVLGRH
ncbi:MAG: helix-turn-helix transcriptional regulator [Coriobacteriales bacterium]|nr:helix-turn-helix transcriptional regulator [Coriobacteriales bacterium]